jgi:hypothetical protein
VEYADAERTDRSGLWGCSEASLGLATDWGKSSRTRALGQPCGQAVEQMGEVPKGIDVAQGTVKCEREQGCVARSSFR